MSQDETDDIKELRASVLRFRLWIQITVAVVLIVYFLWFTLVLRYSASHDPGVWGQFGDFVGGLLNPLIAYAAFHWITRSVLLQGKELGETRDALVKSAKAQTDQVEQSRVSARMAALKCLIDAVTSNIEWTTKELEYVSEQYSRHGGRAPSRTIDGQLVPAGDEIERYLQGKRKTLSELQEARDKWLMKMNDALRLNGGS